MTDYDSIWRTQDEIRTVVNAVLGESIWNLSYNERRMAIELELTVALDDDAISDLCCQFPIIADYDGVGAKGYTQSKPVQTIPMLHPIQASPNHSNSFQMKRGIQHKI